MRIDADRKTDVSLAAGAGTERPAVLLRAAYSNRESAASAFPHPGCFESVEWGTDHVFLHAGNSGLSPNDSE